MAGNVGLLKHASNVPQCALEVEGLFHRAGFPEGAFQTLLISANKVDGILKDPRVVAATLTGSEEAGVKVGTAAATADQESGLGAGRERSFHRDAKRESGRSRCDGSEGEDVNNGQSCIAAKRFIVAESNCRQV